METIYKGTYYDGLTVVVKTNDTLSRAVLYEPITKTKIEMTVGTSTTVTGGKSYPLVCLPEKTKNAPEGVYSLELMESTSYTDGNGSSKDGYKMLSYSANFAKIVKSSEGN